MDKVVPILPLETLMVLVAVAGADFGLTVDALATTVTPRRTSTLLRDVGVLVQRDYLRLQRGRLLVTLEGARYMIGWSRAPRRAEHA